jgi:hypothetical protein
LPFGTVHLSCPLASSMAVKSIAESGSNMIGVPALSTTRAAVTATIFKVGLDASSAPLGLGGALLYDSVPSLVSCALTARDSCCIESASPIPGAA